MNSSDKKDHSKFLIERFDHYYDSVNNKGNLYLVINTFFLGIIISGYAFSQNLQLSISIKWLICIIAILAFVSLIFAIMAINPFLTSGNSKKRKSLIFYGSIAEMHEQHFIDSYKNIDEQKIEEDLTVQIYTLSLGLNEKYQNLKKASIALGIQFTLIIIAIIISLLTSIGS